MINDVFIEISIILAIAAGVAMVMHLLRQPLIIGHIITGLIVGPYMLNVVESKETLEIFSHIGVALLLFIIGLSLNPRIVKEVGKVSLIGGLGQVIFTAGIGYGIALALGFDSLTSWYISIALTFSSTIIVLKLLSDKRELGQLYGKIATGFLLVQDIVATIILIAVTAMSQKLSLTEQLSGMGLKVAGLLVVFFVVSKLMLKLLGRFFAKSQEFLFLFSIAWGLGVASLFKLAGLSIEIGALFAGVALAASPFTYEISSRMRPLRDFFVVVFFILLGAQLTTQGLSELIIPAVVLSAFIIIGNPLIVMILMGIMGYTKKTSFKAGVAVAQISEFSLILIVLAHRVGHVSEAVTSLVTVVGIATIAASSYLIIYSDGLYNVLSPALSIFERKKVRRDRANRQKHDVIIFGYRNTGFEFVRSFQELGHKFVVVDFDPAVIKLLTDAGINCAYGDANDSELLESLDMGSAKLILSTVSDYATNALITKLARKENPKSIIVSKTDNIQEAMELYNLGATYVLMPHYVGSTATTRMIEAKGFDLGLFLKERDKHISYLTKRSELEAQGIWSKK